MGYSVNKVQLLGNVGQEPDIRTFESGNRAANFTLATSERWKDRTTGEQRERTEWHRIAVFNDGLVGVIQKYVRKGSKLYVEGQLRTRKWTDSQGMDRYTTEIVIQNFNGDLVLLDRREGVPPAQDENAYGTTTTASGTTTTTAPAGKASSAYGGAADPDLDDEIPF